MKLDPRSTLKLRPSRIYFFLKKNFEPVWGGQGTKLQRIQSKSDGRNTKRILLPNRSWHYVRPRVPYCGNSPFFVVLSGNCGGNVKLMLWMLQTGHTFERTNIEAHLARSSRCPMSGVMVEDKTLMPNHALRNAIQDYVNEHPAAAGVVQSCRSHLLPFRILLHKQD